MGFVGCWTTRFVCCATVEWRKLYRDDMMISSILQVWAHIPTFLLKGM
jgi:hypothetical protein